MTKMFQDRLQAAEWAFAHAGEVRFLAHCSALKALGEHASARMGLDADAAASYAKDLVADSVDGTKDDALIERVRADLASHGITETRTELRARLTESLARMALKPDAH